MSHFQQKKVLKKGNWYCLKKVLCYCCTVNRNKGAFARIVIIPFFHIKMQWLGNFFIYFKPFLNVADEMFVYLSSKKFQFRFRFFQIIIQFLKYCFEFHKIKINKREKLGKLLTLSLSGKIFHCHFIFGSWSNCKTLS